MEITDCNSVEGRKVKRYACYVIGCAVVALCLSFVLCQKADAQIIRGIDSNGKTRIILVDASGRLLVVEDPSSGVLDSLSLIIAQLRLRATEATLQTLGTEATLATRAAEATVATLGTEATLATLLLETTYRDSVTAASDLLRLLGTEATLATLLTEATWETAYTADVTSTAAPTSVEATFTYATALRSWTIIVTDGDVSVKINGIATAIKMIEGSSLSGGPKDRLTSVAYTLSAGAPNIYVVGAEE